MLSQKKFQTPRLIEIRIFCIAIVLLSVKEKGRSKGMGDSVPGHTEYRSCPRIAKEQSYIQSPPNLRQEGKKVKINHQPKPNIIPPSSVFQH
jgi:hypothetical protein